MDVEEYLNSFPSGYRFVPTDEELILYYLNNKLSNSPLPPNMIRDVIDLHTIHPHQLTSIYKLHREARGEKVWYFFTKKCNISSQHDGFWKAAICGGGDAKEILDEQGNKLGTKATLEGIDEDGNGIKTEWIMNEYRSACVPSEKRLDDEWILCSICTRKDTTPPEEQTCIQEEETDSDG